MEWNTYEELLEEIIGCEALFPFLPEGETLSPLCITRIKGTKGHGFLPLMPEDDVLFSAEQAVFFADGEEPFTTAVSLEPIDLEFDDWDAWETYTRLYPEVFAFAFNAELSANEIELLIQFRDDMQMSLPESMQNLFDEAFPDLFCWMEQILK